MRVDWGMPTSVDGRQRLADEDLKRRHQQLVESPLLAFAGDGQRRQHERLQHAERRDDGPAGFQVQVEPGTPFDGDGRYVAQRCVLGGNDGADIGRSQAGGGGIAPVEDELQRRLPARSKPCLEIRWGADHQQHFAAVDLRGDLIG